MTTITDERAGLRSRCDELLAEMDKLTKHEKLTTSQERRFAELSEEFELVRDRLNGIDRRKQLEEIRSAATGRGGFRIERGSGGDDDEAAVRRRVPTSEVRGRALDLIEQTERSAPYVTHGALEHLTGLVERDDSGVDIHARWVLGTSSPDYRSAFMKAVLGRQHEWSREEAAAIDHSRQLERAMSLTDAAGGYLAPAHLDPSVILTSGGSAHPFNQIARQVTITTDVWNGVSTTGATSSWDAEASEVSDDSPTLAQPSIPVYMHRTFIPYSFEVGEDALNFEAEMSRIMADSVDQLHAAAFTTGTGSGQPTGIVTALAGTASEINGTTMTNAEVVGLQNALPPRWQPNASWVGALATANSIAMFESTNGALLHPGMGEAQRRLLGRPFYENSQMDATIAGGATSDLVLIYGDFRQYVIVRRSGFRVEAIQNLVGANRRPTGQRGLLGWGRTGADSVADSAFVLLDAAS